MDGIFRRRNLPHWDVADAAYFITACLDGSIPAAGLRELEDYRLQLNARPRPDSMAKEDWQYRNQKLVFARFDQLLDHRPGLRHCENHEVASIIREGMYHFANVRYRLLAYVVMPSHFHWVFHPLPEWCATLPHGRAPREVIMHSLKSYTANLCNRVLGQTGRFWQDESYDHWVRDEDELARIIEYVENNPVKARLAADPAEFEFSSAHDRLVGQASSLS